MALSEIDKLVRLAEASAQRVLAAREGRNVLEYKGQDFSQTLTEADLAVSAFLRNELGPALIEEESAAGLTRRGVMDMLDGEGTTYIADPIDGSKPFAGGLTGWGTMIAACSGRWPVVSVVSLPLWSQTRLPEGRREARGLLLAAAEGQAFWAPTRDGKMTGNLAPLVGQRSQTFHVGWSPTAVSDYTLDFTHGFFPWSESSVAADAALLACGLIDATTFNAKLWDLAAPAALYESCGFGLYRFPDLQRGPDDLTAYVDERLSGRDTLWLVCRSREQAERFGRAIRHVPRVAAQSDQIV